MHLFSVEGSIVVLAAVSYLGGLTQAAVTAWVVAGFTLEVFWIGQEGDVEGAGALLQDCLCATVVNGLRRHEADTWVAMSAVVPAEELLAVDASILRVGFLR